MADDPVLIPKPLLATLPDAADLQAIEALTGTGLAARTGTNAWALRTLTAGSGVSITNGDGVSGNPTISATGTGGTVTSVGLSLPSIITVSGSPVTTSGTLTGTLATQTANTVFSGPTSGGAATPTFRALVSADLPSHVHSAADITSGTLAVGRGGTGITTTPANGQIPIGNGSTYTAATITAGTGISVTNGSGSITIANTASPSHGICQARLSNDSGFAVSTTDVTSGSLYLEPYGGNRIALYDGSSWQVVTFTQYLLTGASITNSRPHDIFLNYNSGSPQLTALAWASDTARSTAIVFVDGIYVRNGANTQRYLGTVWANSSGQFANTKTNRMIWNYYNRVEQDVYAEETGAAHTYATATWREWLGSTSYRVAYVVGVLEDAPHFNLWAGLRGTGINRFGFGFNSTTASSNPATGFIGDGNGGTLLQYFSCGTTARRGTDINIGYNYVAPLQYCDTGTGAFEKMRLSGTIRG
jgi:hypothetical protein